MNEEEIQYNERGNPLDEEGHVIRTNKTQVKRDVAELADMVKFMVEVSAKDLAKIPLDDELLKAVKAAKEMKMGALKRQLQYVTKLMRLRETHEIKLAIDAILHARQSAGRAFKQLERWRDRLLDEGNSALTEFCDEYSGADVQRLRQLIRHAQKERSQEKPPRYYRELFQEIKAVASTQNS